MSKPSQTQYGDVEFGMIMRLSLAIGGRTKSIGQTPLQNFTLHENVDLRVAHQCRSENIDWATEPSSVAYLIVGFEPGTNIAHAENELEKVLDAPPGPQAAQAVNIPEPPEGVEVLGAGTHDSGETVLAVGFPEPGFEIKGKTLTAEQTARLCQKAVDAKFPTETAPSGLFDKEEMEQQMEVERYAHYLIGITHAAPNDDSNGSDYNFWMTEFGEELSEKGLLMSYVHAMLHLVQEGGGEYPNERIEP